MGNIAYKSFRRRVTDQQFLTMLQSVINDFCPNEYEVVVDHEIKSSKQISDGAWIIRPKEGILSEKDSKWAYEIDIFRYSGGKFGNKHMRCGDWGYWFTYELESRLCQKFGAILTDEGVSGSWKDTPGKYPTFKSYLNERYDNSASYYPVGWKEKLISKVPEKLKFMSGIS